MSTIFVTSSGTDIGKTYVSALLVRQLLAKGLAVRALKPIVSGLDEESFAASDPAALLAALGELVEFDNADIVSRWRFRAALSPDMAARREGAEIDFGELVHHCLARAAIHDPLVIEGVGGLMVPLDDSRTVLDWMIALKPASIVPLLVVGSYLGSISHTLTTLDVMRRNDLEPRAIVVSESLSAPVPLEETVETIVRFAGIETIALPRNGEPDLASLFE
ncbi:dethiobiotin synthase [Parvibaculum sedimenti]|uniref:ATP-dependent dethiobiotin synthetase BioD n=1 Tax=Parvibaculum sedimenti TaxID=2608632 RepID=A0A6N6VP98_9HYPH|nr:dethiobiotin synthase [Parvibaculum sedimenti]KAB7742665.1 dethiobiotin synthase [Parvibaculum sedimenti]